MSRSRQPLALTLIGLAGLISGCGSSTPTDAGTGTGGAAGARSAHQTTAMRFSQCMRANGVSTFPDPDASGALTLDAVVNGSSLDPNSPAFQQALATCKHLEPAGFTGHKRSAQQQAAALRFAQCVRSSGVPDFPDPTPDGPLVDTTRIPSLDGQGAHGLPALQAAMHKCGALYAGQLGLQLP